MSREYNNIKEYEREILELKKQGLTNRQIRERLGFSREKIKNFFGQYNEKQRKTFSGIEIKPKGRPRKDGEALPPSIQQLSQITQLQYKLAMKERHIKRLEMENEMMRDFLSLIERK